MQLSVDINIPKLRNWATNETCSVLDKKAGSCRVIDKITGEDLTSKYHIQLVDTDIGFFVHEEWTGELKEGTYYELKMVANKHLEIVYIDEIQP